MRSEVDRLRVWDVVFPKDTFTYPPKFKLWVCVSRENLWFLRINSEPITPPDVLLRKVDHPFLDHDSYMGCGGDLIVVFSEEDLCAFLGEQREDARRGIVGRIAERVRSDICAGIAASPRLSEVQKEIVLAELCDGQVLAR